MWDVPFPRSTTTSYLKSLCFASTGLGQAIGVGSLKKEGGGSNNGARNSLPPFETQTVGPSLGTVPLGWVIS